MRNSYGNYVAISIQSQVGAFQISPLQCTPLGCDVLLACSSLHMRPCAMNRDVRILHEGAHVPSRTPAAISEGEKPIGC